MTFSNLSITLIELIKHFSSTHGPFNGDLDVILSRLLKCTATTSTHATIAGVSSRLPNGRAVLIESLCLRQFGLRRYLTLKPPCLHLVDYQLIKSIKGHLNLHIVGFDRLGRRLLTVDAAYCRAVNQA
jgi:hypothetical protein